MARIEYEECDECGYNYDLRYHEYCPRCEDKARQPRNDDETWFRSLKNQPAQDDLDPNDYMAPDN